MKVSFNDTTSYGNRIAVTRVVKRMTRQLNRAHEDLYYSRVNPNIDEQGIRFRITRKLASSPLSIAHMFGAPLLYFRGEINAQQATVLFLKSSPKFCSRISAAKDAPSFSRDYPEEIAIIRNLVHSFRRYRSGFSNKKQLDLEIETQLHDFLQIPQHRNPSVY